MAPWRLTPTKETMKNTNLPIPEAILPTLLFIVAGVIGLMTCGLFGLAVVCTAALIFVPVHARAVRKLNPKGQDDDGDGFGDSDLQIESITLRGRNSKA